MPYAHAITSFVGLRSHEVVRWKKHHKSWIELWLAYRGRTPRLNGIEALFSDGGPLYSEKSHFYLYVMLDVFSRYVVGWMVAHRESATLAERFIHETCARQGIGRHQLTIHADRGPAMTSKSVAFLLADLGITKTHSRPHVSNDNPFSEAQFKTLKYRPAFPERFGAIQDARAHCHVFFPWYNFEHHHNSLALLTPSDVHHGLAEQRVAARAAVLATAYGAHPERFPGGLPQPPACPTEVWINPPAAGSPNIAPDGRSRPALSSGAMIASRREGA